MSTSKSKSYNLWPQGNVNPAYELEADPKESGELRTGNSKSLHEDEYPPQLPAEHKERGQWNNKAEFVLSCVGLSVGLGNVWRFPYLAYKNGGAAFLIAYLILQFFIGKPLYFMELVMGQYSAQGPTGVWKMNPSAKGIGISMLLISLVVAIYYNVIMAYTLYYFFASMQSVLPWSTCSNFAEYDCVERRRLYNCTGNQTADILSKNCFCTGNSTFDSSLSVNCTNISDFYTAQTAPMLYFYKTVTKRSQGLEPEYIGDPLWKVTLCLLLSWIIVVVCLIKGVKSSGKVVYFTATFPYLILLILLVRGATLDGAIDGVKYFVIPQWDKLTDLSVWVQAAGQMFFSLSVCFGGIIMFGSYNKFKNNVYADALFISITDVVTSIIAGFVIFTTFGGLSAETGIPIDKLAEKGYGLAFVAYPEALSRLPVPQLWSLLFFFMLFTLGLDSEFALLETFLTCLQDEYPKLRKHKTVLCIGTGVCCFFLALPCVTPGGDYVVTIMDGYGADFSVLLVAVCETIAVMWIYGARRFTEDVKYMLGFSPHPVWYWFFCWMFTSPVIVGLLFIYRMVKYSPPKYPNGQEFPDYAQTIGWLLSAVVLLPMPLMFIYRFIEAKGSFIDRLKKITSPTEEWTSLEIRKPSNTFASSDIAMNEITGKF